MGCRPALRLLPSPLWRGVGGEGLGRTLTLCDQSSDRVENAVDLGEDLAVPEPQNNEALSLQERRADRIMGETLGLAMLLAIQFDDQPVLQASKVCKARTQCDLSTKVSPGQR